MIQYGWLALKQPIASLMAPIRKTSLQSEP
jgi:hypothetical protein